MKRFLTVLMAIIVSAPLFAQPNWTRATVEGQNAYSITSTDSKGHECHILLFYADYGFLEAWFTLPGQIVEHEDMPRFSVYWYFSYTHKSRSETAELGGRNWSSIGNAKLDQKLEGIISSTIVADGALGAAPFFEYITKSEKPVVIKLPTASGDLVFTVPVLKLNNQ